MERVLTSARITRVHLPVDLFVHTVQSAEQTWKQEDKQGLCQLLEAEALFVCISGERDTIWPRGVPRRRQG